MSTVRIQVRRGVAADWTSVNPILAAGEMGYESDTNKFKFGNGTGTWSTLSYGASDTPGVTEIAQDAINSALSVGTGLTKTYNDGANTITVAIDDAVWATKAYVDSSNSGLVSTADLTYIPFEDRGVANGVASLDSNTTIPAAQISDSSVRNKISVSGNGINYNSTTGALSIDFSNSPTAVANQGYVATQLSNIVNSAPGALDTLKELSDALGSDANFSTTITNSLATKATIASPTFTGTVTIPAGAIIADYDLISDRTTAVSGAITTEATDATTKVAAEAALRVSGDAASVSTAAADATTKADAAKAAAEATAAASLSSAITLEVSNRNTAIATAKSEAIAAAGTDATTKAQGAIDAAAADATTKASNAQTAAISAAAAAADTKVSDHNSDTTNVHGISDTSLLALKSEVAAVTAATLGLGSVDNTADANKPVSSAQATAIATAKSEAIADATAQVNAVIASAPAALNTLDELAAALGDDANYATTVTTALAGKVPSATPISQKTASYTLSSINEKDSMIEMNAAGATTVTIPTDAAVAFPVGTSLDVLRVGAGAVDIAAAGGVTVNATPGLKLRAQWSSATLIKRAANTWVLVGDLSA
jgi:hypothetical protein